MYTWLLFIWSSRKLKRLFFAMDWSHVVSLVLRRKSSLKSALHSRLNIFKKNYLGKQLHYSSTTAKAFFFFKLQEKNKVEKVFFQIPLIAIFFILSHYEASKILRFINKYLHESYAYKKSNKKIKIVPAESYTLIT